MLLDILKGNRYIGMLVEVKTKCYEIIYLLCMLMYTFTQTLFTHITIDT
jgi:hypothetical protein